MQTQHLSDILKLIGSKRQPKEIPPEIASVVLRARSELGEAYFRNPQNVALARDQLEYLLGL